MTLPRFTSGRVGNLDYSNLNEAFDRIEAKDAARMERKGPTPQVILARLVSKDAQERFAWSEVVRLDDGTYEPVLRGVTSSKDGDPYRYPAISTTGGAQVNDVVLISPRRTKTGRLYYTIATSAGTVTRAFIIVGSIPHATRSDAWSYLGRVARIVIQPGIGQVWQQVDAAEYVLVNGAENPVDGTYIGVGTIAPVGVSAVRNPIRAGTVVMASNIGPGWSFSMPNGYTFTCP